MKLGMFMMPYHDPQRDLHKALLEDVETAVHADRVGYDELWVGEHYSAPSEPITCPFTFLANLIARTQRMKLCTGVINLPQQHPAVVAAHVALLDHLSEGRMRFGISSGGLPSDFELFKRMDPKERVSMMDESIDMIVKLWTGEANRPIALHGKHWDISLKDFVIPELGIGTLIKPFQKPHPPIAVSAASMASGSVRLAGRHGWDFISAHFATRAVIRSHWQVYLEGCEAGKRKPDPNAWRVARVVHVGRDDAGAKARLRDPRGPYADFWRYLLGVLGRARMLPLLKTDPAMPDEAVTVEYALDQFSIAGDPRSVAGQILALREEVGDFRMVVTLAIELTDRAREFESMSLMAQEVIPRLRTAMAHAAD